MAPLQTRKPMDGVPSWICEPCREAEHDKCVGHGHCVCQHRTTRPTEPATGPAGE